MANSKVIEIAGRNWLAAQLLVRDLQVATPDVDLGIDLIVFREVGLFGIKALPLQLKCSAGESFGLNRKYEGRGIPLVYIWNVLTEPSAYFMEYTEALNLLGLSVNTESWRLNGSYAITRVGPKLRGQMEQFCNRWDWVAARLAAQPMSG